MGGGSHGEPCDLGMLHTATYNEHWQREGRPSPIEPFPQSESFFHASVVMDLQREIWWEKSRDMMLSWACVAYLTLKAMKTAYYGVLFQTQKDEKVIQLVDYAKHLYRNQDPRSDAGECYNEALAAVKDKIIFNSSAGPGWYADARRDIVRSEE